MAAMKAGVLVVTAVLALDPAPSYAAPQAGEAHDKFHITAEERTACAEDAAALCSTAYPDEDKLLACLKANRASLSSGCRPVFEEGLKRRHLN